MTQTKKIDLNEIPEEELEAFLAKKKAAKKKQMEKEKKAYEASRNKTIECIVMLAIEVQEKLKLLKEKCNNDMELQHEKLNEYGKIRSNSKGGFSITHSDGDKRVTRKIDTIPDWDERAGKGVELLNGYLMTTVKKRDAKLADMLMSFLVRNKEGALKYSAVMTLLQHEEKFTDEAWTEGIRLVKEGYSLKFSKFYYEILTAGKQGKLEAISLNFSSI